MAKSPHWKMALQGLSALLLVIYWMIVLHATFNVIMNRSMYAALAAGLLALPWSLLVPGRSHTEITISIVTVLSAAMNTYLAVWCFQAICKWLCPKDDQ